MLLLRESGLLALSENLSKTRIEGIPTLLATRGEYFRTFTSRGSCGQNPPLRLLRVSNHKFLWYAYTTDSIEGIYLLFALITLSPSPLLERVDIITKTATVPEHDQPSIPRLSELLLILIRRHLRLSRSDILTPSTAREVDVLG